MVGLVGPIDSVFDVWYESPDVFPRRRGERFDERILRLDVLITDPLVEPVRGSSRGARCQPDDEASPLPRPLLRRRHEHAGNPLPTVPLVDDETADEDERFRLEILREN